MSLDVMAEINSERANTGCKCRVGPALDELPAEVAAGYLDAIRKPSEVVAGSAIARALRKRGVTIKDNSIQRHRRDGCTCADHIAPRADVLA